MYGRVFTVRTRIAWSCTTEVALKLSAYVVLLAAYRPLPPYCRLKVATVITKSVEEELYYTLFECRLSQSEESQRDTQKIQYFSNSKNIQCDSYCNIECVRASSFTVTLCIRYSMLVPSYSALTVTQVSIR